MGKLAGGVRGFRARARVRRLVADGRTIVFFFIPLSSSFSLSGARIGIASDMGAAPPCDVVCTSQLPTYCSPLLYMPFVVVACCVILRAQRSDYCLSGGSTVARLLNHAVAPFRDDLCAAVKSRIASAGTAAAPGAAATSPLINRAASAIVAAGAEPLRVMLVVACYLGIVLSDNMVRWSACAVWTKARGRSALCAIPSIGRFSSSCMQPCMNSGLGRPRQSGTPKRPVCFSLPLLRPPPGSHRRPTLRPCGRRRRTAVKSWPSHCRRKRRCCTCCSVKRRSSVGTVSSRPCLKRLPAFPWRQQSATRPTSNTRNAPSAAPMPCLEMTRLSLWTWSSVAPSFWPPSTARRGRRRVCRRRLFMAPLPRVAASTPTGPQLACRHGPPPPPINPAATTRSSVKRTRPPVVNKSGKLYRRRRRRLVYPRTHPPLARAQTAVCSCREKCFFLVYSRAFATHSYHAQIAMFACVCVCVCLRRWRSWSEHV